MAKLTLTDISSGYGLTTTINANNALIEAALENTLSRDGSAPNTMSAALDMNSQRITNLPNAVNNSEPVTLGQAATIAGVTTPITEAAVTAVLYAQTSAEAAAGVTPTDTTYPPGNALRYGAVGDGVTNDKDALQTWLNCGESHLTLPYATYLLSSGISLSETSNVGKIEGLGMPVLKRDGAVSASSAFPILSIYDENKVEITGIKFDGNGATISPVTPTDWGDVAVIATLTANPNTTVQTDYWVTFTNCEFVDACGTCVAGAGMQNCTIQNCRFDTWQDHAVYMSGDVGGSPGSNRGLGTNVIVDGCILRQTSNANSACKITGNSRRYIISNNVWDLTGEGCMQITPNSASIPREVVFSGNTGSCGWVADFAGNTNSSNDDIAHFLFADNNMLCDTRGFYIGDSAGSPFSGHLHIKGGVYTNTAGAWKTLLESRFFDNANSETSIILDGVSMKDFGVQQGTWPLTFVMKNCVCDQTYASWFFASAADSAHAKHVVIEGNQFLNPTANQGVCQFRIYKDSVLIIRGNTYETDGIACSISTELPEVVIFEDNTMLDVQGIVYDAAATARTSVGTMIVKNNKCISTTGSSVNVRLFEENSTTGVVLDSYNVFLIGNYFRNANAGVRFDGTAVTGYSGSQVVYGVGNYGTGSSFTCNYPAANESSFLPNLGIITEYTITNDTPDRTFDADTALVTETNDVLATLLKDLGHGA